MQSMLVNVIKDACWRVEHALTSTKKLIKNFLGLWTHDIVVINEARFDKHAFLGVIVLQLFVAARVALVRISDGWWSLIRSG